MKERRAISQVVFNYLPDQTVDLAGSVWRVARWSDPRHISVDAEVVRRDLLRAIYPWTSAEKDNGMAEVLFRGGEIELVSPSEQGGVVVERFPKIYRCRVCGRIRSNPDAKCVCGGTKWAQMQYVAFHQCGRLDTPWVQRCEQHNDVRVSLSKTAAIRDIRFECPVCGKLISEGFRFAKCPCGKGTMQFNLHRAAAVFGQRTTAIVNPPDSITAAQYQTPAATESILHWVLGGMQESGPLQGRPTLDSLVAMFIAQGLSEAISRDMARAAAGQSGGAVATVTESIVDLPSEVKHVAQESALKLAYAVAKGRIRRTDLVRTAGAALALRYENQYQRAVEDAGLHDVELLENFPVVHACFGYTRDERAIGSSTLRWYRSSNGGVRVYGYRSDTEALLFTLDPLKVAAWLRSRGHLDTVLEDPRQARLAVLQACSIPDPGTSTSEPSAGADLLTLVHSYSHRVLRRISAYCGIERDSLSEYLVPLHLGFIVYASQRGDFVLGGLQALFENDLDQALHDMAFGESRCALDPGCKQNGAACAVCLHVGEPSCRYYNQYLSRDYLFGPTGFLVG